LTLTEGKEAAYSYSKRFVRENYRHLNNVSLNCRVPTATPEKHPHEWTVHNRFRPLVFHKNKTEPCVI